MRVSLNDIYREREKSRSMSPVVSNGGSAGANDGVKLDFRGSPSLFHDYITGTFYYDMKI